MTTLVRRQTSNDWWLLLGVQFPLEATFLVNLFFQNLFVSDSDRSSVRFAYREKPEFVNSILDDFCTYSLMLTIMWVNGNVARKILRKRICKLISYLIYYIFKGACSRINYGSAPVMIAFMALDFTITIAITIWVRNRGRGIVIIIIIIIIIIISVQLLINNANRLESRVGEA